MLKVRTLQQFEDFKEHVTRKIGDEFEVTEERGAELVEKLAQFSDKPFFEVVEDTDISKTPEEEKEPKTQKK